MLKTIKKGGGSSREGSLEIIRKSALVAGPSPSHLHFPNREIILSLFTLVLRTPSVAPFVSLSFMRTDVLLRPADIEKKIA